MGKKINLYSTCVALHDRSCSYYKKIDINVNRCIVVVTDFRRLRRRGAKKHAQWNIKHKRRTRMRNEQVSTRRFRSCSGLRWQETFAFLNYCVISFHSVWNFLSSSDKRTFGTCTVSHSHSLSKLVKTCVKTIVSFKTL